jgi:aspartyl-tRNA synthetase
MAAEADQVAQELQDKLSTQASAGGESSTVDGSSAGGGKTKNQLKKEAKVRPLPPPTDAAARSRACALAAAAYLPRALSLSPSLPPPPPSTPTPTPPTPKQQAAEKAAREAEKAAAAAQRGVKQAAPTAADPDDPLKAQYGDPPLVQSAGPSAGSGRVWTPLEDLTPAFLLRSGGGDDSNNEAAPAAEGAGEEGKPVLVRCRLAGVRAKGKSAFLVLRQRTATLQAVMFADDVTVSRAMVKYASAIPKESIVDVAGLLVKAKEPIASCTQSDVELKVRGVWAVSRAAGALPFELVDASRSDADVAAAAEKGELLAKVEQNVRLDNRALDLRTPASQAIFRVQSAVCQLFRGTMLELGFQEIHTPKLISGASEGGAAVFAADYMGRPACLAQSPQLYKQMAIVADFDRVFEIGPVFRAENSFTHRHLCEFTGLDFEMAIKEHYSEVMDVIERIFMDMFAGIEKGCGKDLQAIRVQYPFEPIVAKPLRLTFEGELSAVRAAQFWPRCVCVCVCVCVFLCAARARARAHSPETPARQAAPHDPPPLNNYHQNQQQRASRCCARTATRTSTLWATSTPSWSALWAPSSRKNTAPTFSSSTASPWRSGRSIPCPLRTMRTTATRSTCSSAARRSSPARSACTTPTC